MMGDSMACQISFEAFAAILLCLLSWGVYIVVALSLCRSKPAIRIRKALIFLENTAGLRIPVLIVVLSRSCTLKTLNSQEYLGMKVLGNIADRCRLMLPVMFPSIALKCMNQTAY